MDKVHTHQKNSQATTELSFVTNTSMHIFTSVLLQTNKKVKKSLKTDIHKQRQTCPTRRSVKRTSAHLQAIPFIKWSRSSPELQWSANVSANRAISIPLNWNVNRERKRGERYYCCNSEASQWDLHES